ncbi:MAG: hypothetical protein ACM3W4_03560 [Ignavibacteriales bacterium]
MSSKVSTRLSSPAAEARTPGDIDLLFRVDGGFLCAGCDGGELGRDLGQRLADRAVGEAKQAAGLTVGGGDPALLVDAENAGADAQQHGLDELTARLGLVAGCLQGRLLSLKIGRHLIESTG